MTATKSVRTSEEMRPKRPWETWEALRPSCHTQNVWDFTLREDSVRASYRAHLTAGIQEINGRTGRG